MSENKDNRYLDLQELQQSLDSIENNVEAIIELPEDKNWDAESNRIFEKRNAVLWLVPSILCLAVILYTFFKISVSQVFVAETVTDTVGTDKKIRDTSAVSINSPVFNIGMPNNMNTNRVALPPFSRSDNAVDRGLYYLHNILPFEPSITINLIKIKPGMLVMKNDAGAEIQVKVKFPEGLDVKAVMFESYNGLQLTGADGTILKGEELVFSGEKMARVKGNLILEIYQIPSGAVAAPFQTITIIQ